MPAKNYNRKKAQGGEDVVKRYGVNRECYRKEMNVLNAHSCFICSVGLSSSILKNVSLILLHMPISNDMLRGVEKIAYPYRRRL